VNVGRSLARLVAAAAAVVLVVVVVVGQFGLGREPVG
jgi:hypothetical protein